MAACSREAVREPRVRRNGECHQRLGSRICRARIRSLRVVQDVGSRYSRQSREDPSVDVCRTKRERVVNEPVAVVALSFVTVLIAIWIAVQVIGGS
jgi:hypothetical protein